MELMQLRMFLAVAEEGSVRRGAERVFRTPPAVSIAIHKLEEEVNRPLFARLPCGKRVLTPAGEVAMDYAKRLLALHDEAVDAIKRVEVERRVHLPYTKRTKGRKPK